MRNPELILDPAIREGAPDVPSAQSDENAGSASGDIANPRAVRLERAYRLGRQLRIQVTFDDAGWLRNEIELVFTKASDGTIWPVKVRVGCEASDEEVLARGGVVAHCAQYNAALRTLRQLGERLTGLVHQGRIILAPGSPVAYAHRELSRLDELIAQRQAITMGYGVVRIATLVREIEFFERCDAHLAPIVHAADRAMHTAPLRDATAPRSARRWLRWVTLGLTVTRRE